jgi:hypothetical protein
MPETMVDPAAAAQNAQYSIQGYLVLDTGLPAASISTLLYSIGFAGKDAKLGETRTDAQGNYAISYSVPGGASPSLQVRVLDPAGKEVVVSHTKFNASKSETLNLVVPGSVQPLVPEFQRMSADMEKFIGGIGNLGAAREAADRQDLTLLNQSTNWDARLVALAATAAQRTATTGVSQDALYALFRFGLPTDPSQLAMVPAEAVRTALTKANQAGVVALNDKQILEAKNAFQTFAAQTHLATTTPGGVSKFSDLLGKILEGNQQAAFASLYLANPTASDFWTKAAALNIPAKTLDLLKVQGKLLYLTLNSEKLAAQLQNDVGSAGDLSQLAYKDYHRPETWQNTLKTLAGNGGDQALQALIPGIYPGKSGSERLVPYSADLARKVRMSFPTEVTARMVENNEIPLKGNTGGQVAAFLKAAAPQGYKLGRTPLNAFLNNPPAGLPALDVDGKQSLKTLHRLFQVTPSPESLQAAMKLGFTSAHDIAVYSKEDFLGNYATYFPPGEARVIYGQAQTVSSVTFNFFAMAKQLDTTAPAYAFSASETDRQNAKSAIVQQFPTMASLFGNLDFCQCEDCRSVLSPAAYFVDVLEFLNTAGKNAKGISPLDVLIGQAKTVNPITVTGRRPDLAALPLTCENTNTSMPYIDLVNEILEYYIANSHMDANAAYDTGTATTADLTAEPQHILPIVYTKFLKQAVYPLNLPFDLWIETVRRFLNYFNEPLAQVLQVLQTTDTLELFTDAKTLPYYLAQILSESLGISPAEYGVLTSMDPVTLLPSVTNWFQLYGYPDQGTATAELKSAKTMAQQLGLTYQELTDLVTTGFLNQSLYSLIFQFDRFGIEMSDAFSYTGQPGGYPPLTGQDKTDFEALLDGITARYKALNSSSSFNARTWLANVLPANYSKKVLALNDPDSGCDFSGTTLQYANGSPALPLDYLKFNLFTRLWKKLGWTLDETDRAMQLFFPANLPPWSDPGFAAAFSNSWKTALVYLAHLDDLNTRLAPALGRVALLPFWANLPVQGDDPLYSQLFLTSSVLNNDWAFDDPNGQFPTPLTDFAPPPPPPPLTTFAAHQATVQGVLGLTSDEINAVLTDAGKAVDTVTIVVSGGNVNVPSFTLNNLSICYRYAALTQCLQVPVEDLISLKALSGLNPFQPFSGNPLAVLADDVAYTQTLALLKQVATVQNSGFTVEDLQYLLRQQFDPVGVYQDDPNALTALVQSLGSGLRQIQAKNAVPPPSMSESLIDQTLSGLFPAGMLTNLFSLLSNSQSYTASSSPVLPANKIDPTPFVAESEISFSYDPVSETQSVTCVGLLVDSKKAQLKTINGTPLFSGLLDQLQTVAQQALVQRVGDLLGVWASLVQYQAVQNGPPPGLPDITLMPLDAALSLGYDESDSLQWLGYRGVLTDAKKNVLTSVALPAPQAALLAALLNNVQQQSQPAYPQLAGSILAMWVNMQSYVSTQPSGTAIDSVAFFNALSAAQQARTITDPVPQLQFSFDSTLNQQTLTCTGIFTDAMRLQLEALPPASPLLGTLLQDVRNQAVATFQELATSLLTVTANDLDTYAKPFIGTDATKQRKQVKAELVQSFLPLQAQKLSRQLVLQTLSSTLASDPTLTEALVTDAALLSDPTSTGTSLLPTFLAVGQQGVSALFFVSIDSSGPSQSGGIAATADTADPTNNKPGTRSAHFEGYLQVPTDGPYRFFAELGDVGAAAALQIDSPDPTALFANPIISPTQKAAKAGDEVSQFVQLKGGVAYHFTLDFSNLAAHGASLLIQGETLPKGPLSQILLYPEQVFTNFSRAKTLLFKVLKIVQVTGLDLREISYLVANSAQFNNLRLSSLPTLPSDDSPLKATALFSQFLTLADYADLRKGPAGGTDGLIDVFQAAAQSAPKEPNTPWTILANLTRRDSQLVHDVASALGPDPHFVNNTGIRRIWSALQLVQIVRIPVAALSAATLIASQKPPANPTADQIAASFKNAVKAQYTAATWRPIAQSVFDKLRQKKRDALVAYLVQLLSLENSNQLFEYFLVDPGMEPVVQTSRLRLAMSSVQTFVQRCLLNLENANSNPALDVAPDAIDANLWEWMKRYRVWQANREIFLYPENWMQPELRLDKSDLFQTLESTLLQGDVTNDLVDSALLKYLQDLDLRARLDIVACYLEQNLSDNGPQILHTFGRTYAQPHKYFYRTYANGAWSAWEAVNLDIDGNHIVLVVWRGRLNVFWATFLSQALAPQSSSGGGGSDTVSNLHFGDLVNDIFSGTSEPQVKIQLHWSEYLQGKWTTPISTDVNKFQPVVVPQGFDANNIPIHVSTEVDVSGSEGAVRIHLDLAFPDGGASFRVTSKNCDADFSDQYWQPATEMVYNLMNVDATMFTGSGSLNVSFQSDIYLDGTSTTDNETILQTVNSYAVLPCSNLVVPSPLFLDPQEQFYQEAGALISPFFFKDTADASTTNELTFFVQPSLTEKTVVDWEWWAVVPPTSAVNWGNLQIIDQVEVIVQVPLAGPVRVNPGDPVYSVCGVKNSTDWLTNPATAVSYGGAVIGKNGGLNLGNAVSALGPGAASLSSAGLLAGRSITLVGTQGLSTNQLRGLKATRSTSSTASLATLSVQRKS